MRVDSAEYPFLDDIRADPGNPIPRLVYADWLEEGGDRRAELIRRLNKLIQNGRFSRSQGDFGVDALRLELLMPIREPHYGFLHFMGVPVNEDWYSTLIASTETLLGFLPNPWIDAARWVGECPAPTEVHHITGHHEYTDTYYCDAWMDAKGLPANEHYRLEFRRELLRLMREETDQ